MFPIRILVVFAGLASFSKGQKYFVGEENPEEYFTNPQLQYYQPNRGNFFIPRDLQTSELPTHLQHTLPQYQQFVNARQTFQPSVSYPFNDYVVPSTHRPDYSRLNPPQHLIKEKLHTRVNHVLPKGDTNQLEGHFSKRDSPDQTENEYVYEDEEYEEEPEEEESRSKTVDEVKPNDTKNKSNNELGEEEYQDEEVEDEEYEEEEELPDEDRLKNEIHQVLTTKPPNTSRSNEFEEVEETTTRNDNKAQAELPQLVVSVVTSKTIVNNTVIPPVVLMEPSNNITDTTIRFTPENTTDSWIVVASVQTSRSVSGAHYIPSSSVDQDERRKLLNEPVNVVTEPTVPDNYTLVSSTLAKVKTSTESLIDKLDRVQSDLYSGLLTGGFKNDNIALIEETMSTKLETTTTTTAPTPSTTKKPYPQVNIRKYDPGNRRPASKKSEPKPVKPAKVVTEPVAPKKVSNLLDQIQPVEDISALLPPGYKLPTESGTTEAILKNVKQVDDISALLPPGYKPPGPSTTTQKAPLKEILAKAKPVEDISALLPPGYKPPSSTIPKIKPVEDISALLPPGYKASGVLAKANPIDDISSLLPPGYKPPEKTSGSTFNKAKPVEDISSLLPPGYKPPKTTEKTGLLAKAVPVDDISALLPPGYRKGFSKPKVTTPAPVAVDKGSQNIPANLLPPGYNSKNSSESSVIPTATTSAPVASSTASTQGFKVVFPSRPGGGSRKSASRLTTPKPHQEEVNKVTVPTIQKGWPVRASTEFTGWPTPSTTPISIEKLLEAARHAHTSTTTEAVTEPSSTTTTTTTTTTTPRPTTPGVCSDDCDLAGTIKLVGGAKWVPELLDPNTKEYQILANSVQSELESIYNNSPVLKKWYTKIRIDGFSEGSILVDYLVEFNEVGKMVNTQEIKRLFHDSLTDIASKSSNREGKSLNESKAEKLTLGQFEVDTKYTDFIVIPKHQYPTVGYADDVLLPQWAIAVIVIGLASLLFVIIFGVSVLFNRHKSAKKTPVPLTEDMLNELNKNHMGGMDNYGADDFYNMEDVWSDNHYEQKPQKKRNHNGSVYDNSTAQLYDSWRSQWNGQWSAYNNGGYGYGRAGSQHSGHSGFRRPDRDTNF